MLETQVQVRELKLAEAIREAIAEEMRRDPKVFLCGEDVAEAGHPFKVLTGLVNEFGKERILDTPISEPGFTGIAVGAAMTGMRPIVDIMFGDFGSNGHADDAWRLPPFGGTALAVAARMVLPYSRSQGRHALDALRREGPAQDRDSR
jgi:hypothetical protein